MTAPITRHQGTGRMSRIVEHNGNIYLCGQVGNRGDSVADQTRTPLLKIDELLGSVGSDKTRILSATIWLADMADFEAMNAVWDAWVVPGHEPARACGEAKLASPELAVEILIIAAAGA